MTSHQNPFPMLIPLIVSDRVQPEHRESIHLRVIFDCSIQCTLPWNSGCLPSNLVLGSWRYAWCSSHLSYPGPEKCTGAGSSLSLSSLWDSAWLSLQTSSATFSCKYPVAGNIWSGKQKEAINYKRKQRRKKKKVLRQWQPNPGWETVKDITDNETDLEAQEQEKQAVEILCLHKLLHCVDLQNSSWSCALSVVPIVSLVETCWKEEFWTS